MPQEQDQRRQPAILRNIDSIDPQRDVRVRIVGTVLEVREDSIMLDDGSGTTEVFLDVEDQEAVEDGMRIRVFGRVLPTPDDFEIQGEIVQDMTDLDMDLFNEVRELTNLQQPS